jgi:hypothetical protein
MIYFLFPETKNLTLEKIDYLFLKEDRLHRGETIAEHSHMPHSKGAEEQQLERSDV